MKPVRLLSAVFAFLLFGNSIFAQRVDLDRFYFNPSYLLLPQQYTEPEKRTFGVQVECGPSIATAFPKQVVNDKIRVSGFKRVEADPLVGITLELDEVKFERSEASSRTEERKDKDGKVVGRDTYHRITVFYNSSGRYVITGPKAAEAARQPEPAKAEAKANRFLQASAPAAAPTSGLGIVDRGFLSKTLTHTTAEFSSAAEASRYIQENQSAIRDKLVTQYVNESIGYVNMVVDNKYGYAPTQTREFLWILDSKRHPEYEAQQEAIKAVKQLMQGMSATQPLDDLRPRFQPVLDYFNELKTKYTSDDKADKKIRYSAFFNLATLYYFLDEPDKAVEAANNLVKNDYDTKDGEKLAKQAEELKAALARHKTATRHLNM